MSDLGGMSGKRELEARAAVDDASEEVNVHFKLWLR